jgi:L-ascorbate metabolism protein UlaG (beta-lactamase superfamily)
MMAMLGTKSIPEEFEGWMAKYPQGEQLNFVFDIPGEKRVYMAGSYPAPEVIEVAGRVNADITLLQVLPGRTLRGIEEATAQVALASGCKMVIPQHHDPLLPGAVEADLSRLKEILAEKSDVVFEEWVPGEWHVIGSAGF